MYDATGVTDSTELRQLYDFFHPQARARAAQRPGDRAGHPGRTSARLAREATAQRALEGLVRSIGKEFGRGITAQLVYVTAATPAPPEPAWSRPCGSCCPAGPRTSRGRWSGSAPAGRAPRPTGTARWTARSCLVTGAARGIGAALARVLARDGARSSALDIPAAGDALAAVANEIGGTAVQLDLTAPDAPTGSPTTWPSRHGRVDVVVHNAGITRDKTLGRMDADRWDSVLDVNLSSQERINDVLLERELIPAGGRIISVSSIAGIAGNRGQTNYATSKAGVIGLVDSLAPALAERGISVNAVAPGFIETRLTARIPLVVREAGRRMNSLAQGGLPVDVAETIGWLAWPASGAVSGNVVRVCGQSLLGA